MNMRNKTFAGLEELPFYGVAGSTFLHVNILARPAGSKRRRDIWIMHKLRWLGEGKGNLWGVRRGGISDLSLEVLISLSLGEYFEALVWNFPVMTSLSVYK